MFLSRMITEIRMARKAFHMKRTILRLLSVFVCITMLAVTTPEFAFRSGIAEGLAADTVAPDVTDAANDAVRMRAAHHQGVELPR